MKKTALLGLVILISLSLVIAVDDKEVDILPDNPLANETLLGYVNCTGGFGPSYNVTYEWYVNNGFNSNGTITGIAENVSINVANFTGDITDTIEFRARCELGANPAYFNSSTEILAPFCGGDIIGTNDYTMTQDLNCDGFQGRNHYLNITDYYNGTFDCNGYSIIGTAGDNSADVFRGESTISGPPTITNCNFINTSGMFLAKTLNASYNNFTNNCGWMITMVTIPGVTYIHNNKIGPGSFVGSCIGSGGIQNAAAYNVYLYDNIFDIDTYPIFTIGGFKNWTIWNNKFNSSSNDTITLSTIVTPVTGIKLNSSYDCSSPNIIGGTCQGGNYWSAYPGTDSNGDGIGDTDVPFTIFSYGGVDYNDSLPLTNSPTSPPDSTAPTVNITYPTDGLLTEFDNVTSVFWISVEIIDTESNLSACWYNYWNSSGFPGPDTFFSCANGSNSFNLTVDYFGSHILLVTANDTLGNEGSDQLTWTIQLATPSGGGGGGGEPKEEEVPVPFFVREESFDFTCGIDGDQDGLLCDPNEDWISCPEDCELPSLDALLCLSSACVWREAWFLKMLFAMLLMITLYFVYLDYQLPKRRRKIFR